VLIYLAQRLLQALPLLAGIVVLNFALVNLAPGDPIYIIAGAEEISPRYEAELRARFNLDKPPIERFVIYAGELLRGNLGYSIYFKQPVLDLFLSRVGATLLLFVPQFVISALLGVALGVISATRRGRWQDTSATVLALLGYSLPLFWLGQLCIGWFAIRLQWLPAGGMVSLQYDSEGLSRLVDIGRHLILPTFVLALSHLALVTRITRASLLEVLRLDYVRTARSKGLAERLVIHQHALRNAILPVITTLGLSFGFILSGSVLAETVFSWPGVGRLTYQAIIQRDYPLMLGLLLISSTMVIVVNILTDLLYSAIDPRIRYR
jgi:ABC-type dipeptide/oligopeptide/nickel transport system permease component